MKKNLLRAFVFILLAGLFHACNDTLIEETITVDPALKSAQSNKITYIVVLDDAELNTELANIKGYEMRQQAAKKAAEMILNRAAVTDHELGFVYNTAIKGFSVKIPPGQLKKLENDPSVMTIEEDQVVTLIEPNARPGDGDVEASATQITPWGITRVNGGVTYTGSAVAWVIDTGIDLDHPDLNVDDTRGAVFVNASTPDDDNGHGSHVAGTIAAINNTEGVIGVAAGATVIPVKVLDRRGSGSYSGVIAGIDYVALKGEAGDVANMSLGGPFSQIVNNAVISASENGIKFSLAAGNESTDAINKSPASANGDNIFTISAMDNNDNFASFSNYGNPPVDYCAPGVSITSTYKNGGYTTYSGTSMAAPHVAGIMLLGSIQTDGYVNNDPDKNPDPIAVHGGGDTPSNHPPVANAGEDIIVNDNEGDGENVTLNGSNSYDLDKDELSYSWFFESSVISTVESFSYNFPVGVHTITLTVSDGIASSSDNVIVTVNPGSTSNVAPEINTFDLTNTSNPAMKRVQVSWSVTDSNGDLETVETLLSGPGTASAITTVSGSSASGIHELSIKKGSSGTYTVTIIVKDSEGNIDTDSKNITL